MNVFDARGVVVIFPRAGWNRQKGGGGEFSPKRYIPQLEIRIRQANAIFQIRDASRFLPVNGEKPFQCTSPLLVFLGSKNPPAFFLILGTAAFAYKTIPSFLSFNNNAVPSVSFDNNKLKGFEIAAVV